MRQACHLLIALLLSVMPGVSIGASELSEPQRGRIFYVRQTVGDDASDGLSPDDAWQSVSPLASVMEAGDIAYVGPGLYREAIVLANSGTADNPIALIADTTGEHTGDPPGIVMITGADAVDESIFVPQATRGVYMAPSPEKQVMGAVEMDGPQYRYTDVRDTVEFIKEQKSALDVVAEVPETFFYDSEAKVVYIHTSDGKPPSTHELELIRRRDGVGTYGKHYISVTGFTFRHMRTAGINFDTGSSHCTATNNTSYGSWQGIRAFGSTDVLLVGNTMFRNGNSGAYFLGAATNGFAIGNILYDNTKGVRWSSASANGLAIENIAFANREIGISIENSEDIRVAGNVLANNAIAQLLVKKAGTIHRGIVSKPTASSS